MMTYTVHAQSDLENRVTTMLQDIDTAPIAAATGIFYDQVPEYLAYKQLPYDAVVDSLRMNEEGFKWVHNMLAYAYLDTINPLRQDSMWEYIDFYKSTDLVAIGSILYTYDRFRDNVIEDSLIYYDGERFQHHPSAGSSPFMRDTVVITSTIYDKALGDTIKFYIPSDLYYTNMDTVVSVELDFSDGGGYVPVNFDNVIPIVYNAIDTFDINIRYTLQNNEVLYAGTSIVISEAPQAVYDRGLISHLRTGDEYHTLPDGSHHIGAISQACVAWRENQQGELECIEWEDVPTDGVEIFYWLNQECAEPRIRKPLIIIDGFDPLGERSFEFLINGDDAMLDMEYELPDPFKDLIHDEGYDLIFLNCVDGGTFIQDNAAFIKQALEWINEQKVINNSQELNMVIGASMGGLLGKWALREFELQGEDHETELYITMDSPLRGANIPLALQSLPIKLGSKKYLGKQLKNYQEELKIGHRQIMSPAARQMLYYHMGLYEDEPIAPEIYSQDISKLTKWHDEFYNQFWARGDLDVPHIAISNGSRLGQGQSFVAGDKIQDFTENSLLPPFLGVKTKSDGWALPGENGHTFYKIKQEFDLVFLPFIDPHTYRVTGNIINYDSAPGGMRAFELLEDGSIGNENEFLHDYFCFIPTISALDIKTTDDPFASIENNIGSHLRSYQGATEVTVLNGVSYFNQDHVTFNKDLVEYFFTVSREIDIDVSWLANRTFNFGFGFIDIDNADGTAAKTENIIDEDLTIGINGKLWINRNDKIAYTDVAENIQNLNPQTFAVYLSKTHCDAQPVTIEVESSGDIRVGDDSVNNIGELYITEDNRINIHDGGSLNIEHASKVVVEENGILEFFTGSRLVIQGDGQLLVQPGGRLILHDGAEIILEDELAYNGALGSVIVSAYDGGSRILLNGELNLPQGAVTIRGQGGLVFLTDHEIVSGNGQVALSGHGTDYISYVIASPVSIGRKDIEISDAFLLFHNDLSIFSGSLTMNNTKHVWTHHSIYSPPLEASDINVQRGDVAVTNSTFDDIGLNAYLRPLLGQGLEGAFSLDGVTSHTTYNDHNFRVEHAYRVHVVSSQISTSKPDNLPSSYPDGIDKVGLELTRCTWADVKNTDISDFVLQSGNPLRGDDHSEVRDDPGQAHPFSSAIRLDQVGWLGVKSSRLSNNYYGVKAKSDFNIRMDEATVLDNRYGVHNAVGTQGMLKMICSNMIHNDYGVQGYDITLVIDGVINAQHMGGGLTRNVYDNTKHFEIRYIEKELPAVIPARFNSWVNPDAYYIYDGVDQAALAQAYEGLSCGPFFTVPDCDAVAPSFPQYDPAYDDSLYVGLDTVIVSCRGNELLEKYWRAYNCMYHGEYESGMKHFADLAEIRYETDKLTRALDHILEEVVSITHISFMDSLGVWQHDSTAVATWSSNSIINLHIEQDCYRGITEDSLTLYFLVDASASIDSVEWIKSIKSIGTLLRQLSRWGIPYTYTVAQFSGSDDFYYAVENSSDYTAVERLSRLYSGTTDVKGAIRELSADISTDAHVIIMTDATQSQFNAPPFNEYDDIKTSNGATVNVVRWQIGTPLYDDPANAVGAAISSAGGDYNGFLYSNPNDPEGGVMPRRFIESEIDTIIPGLAAMIRDCYVLSVGYSSVLDSASVFYWTADGGGVIYGDSVNVHSITTNGTGTYTLHVKVSTECVLTTSFTYELGSGTTPPERVRIVGGQPLWPHQLEGQPMEVVEQATVVRLYPNPTHKQLTLDMGGKVGSAYEILDMSGRAYGSGAITSEQTDIAVNHLMPGVYTLRISLENGSYKHVRFVKL